MTTQWSTIFSPVAEKGREAREGQALLGQEIIDVIENGGTLMGEAATGTGKSFAVAIPMINEVLRRKSQRKFYKCVISTETITLQTQLVDKDLPFLKTLYPGFTFRKLMGRSNYICFNSASLLTKGRMDLHSTFETLKTRQLNLGDGEHADMERVLGRTVNAEEWEFFVGSSKFCVDNQCEKDKCYAARARELAMLADIVVVNHAILATDIEMKVTSGGGAFADGMLGPINVLAVDEAHKLEAVLVDQWTKKLTDWELADQSASVLDAINIAMGVTAHATVAHNCVTALDGMQEVLTNIQNFYHRICLMDGVDWDGSETALSLKYLTGADEPTTHLMNEFENENPKRLAATEKALIEAVNYLTTTRQTIVNDEMKLKGMRNLNKGLRAAKDLLETVRIISKAIETKNGIVQQYGAFGVVVDGWRRRNGDKGMTIRLTPLDVSHRAKALWAGIPTCIAISATLRDLTENNFRYARTSIAFPPGKEIIVDTPFELGTQQLIYVTKKEYPKVEEGQYSFQEMVELIKATKGRALVLFTSRKELDYAAQALKHYQGQNWAAFPYKIFVQEKDSNKSKLATDFKSDVNSVLLATKSFFTGFDAPGETVSIVILAKWPLPRYSVTCRQQITHWRMRRFPNWYAMLSLTDALQGAGRLVRSSDCKGVIALLDFRVYDSTSNVSKIATTGIDALGSPVTDDIQDVAQFVE